MSNMVENHIKNRNRHTTTVFWRLLFDQQFLDLLEAYPIRSESFDAALRMLDEKRGKFTSYQAAYLVLSCGMPVAEASKHFRLRPRSTYYALARLVRRACEGAHWSRSPLGTIQ